VGEREREVSVTACMNERLIELINNAAKNMIHDKLTEEKYINKILFFFFESVRKLAKTKD
jgi:hypothetical protein